MVNTVAVQDGTQTFRIPHLTYALGHPGERLVASTSPSR